MPHDAPRSLRARRARVATTSFVSLLAVVGLALYGLPFFYDFMVRDFGWTRAQVTSGMRSASSSSDRSSASPPAGSSTASARGG
jgi:hypothetical protein